MLRSLEVMDDVHEILLHFADLCLPLYHLRWEYVEVLLHFSCLMGNIKKKREREAQHVVHIPTQLGSLRS